MQLIKELLALQDADVAALNAEFEQLEEMFDDVIDKTLPILSEGATQEPRWWEEIMGLVMKRFDAARRGLGLVNKLTPGPERAKHASRVMTNMNTIRSTIAKIQKKIEQTMINKVIPDQAGGDYRSTKKPTKLSPAREPSSRHSIGDEYMTGVRKHATMG